ncbi:hypothetical protein BpHYR1_029943 [Brachionus plicatilis]|uniref:Uncharacterized protein n=1 Tax=Brachionus plicatilis TaxID=10195 RepID=A0A3M7QME7_BRAPC|nr:hypothetical protein BpHYR1_029943 [Brachionus plicatilis]
MKPDLAILFSFYFLFGNLEVEEQFKISFQFKDQSPDLHFTCDFYTTLLFEFQSQFYLFFPSCQKFMHPWLALCKVQIGEEKAFMSHLHQPVDLDTVDLNIKLFNFFL